MFLQNSLLYISSHQTFYLNTSSSSLEIESNARQQTFKVAGWGNRNLFGFSMKIQSFDYDDSTGTLSVQSGIQVLHLLINSILVVDTMSQR